ncbi:MAG: DUF1566 domain-containing protein, partial [Pseudomonas sp.]
VVMGPTYAAAIIAGAPAKILTGQILAGVNGTATAAPADCALDGATNCVAVPNFPAVDKVTNLSVANRAKIHTSVTVAGVVGTLANCSTDGGTNCMAITGYPAANATGAAAKILVTQTLAGIAGSAAGKPADCAADAAVGCVTVTNFPAVDKLTKLSAANAAKIRSGLTIAGVAGTLADCSTDGGTNCVATGGTYVAALTTGADAKILSGQTLAGISGIAAGKPVDCSSDGGIGCVTIAAYPAAQLSGGAVKILTGQTLAGITGTGAGRPSDCATDGGTECVAIANFPAVNKVVNLSTANRAKIHSSVTVGGLAGTLADCSVDGAQGCYTVSAYRAATFAGAAAKIISTATLVGIAGTATAAPADCAADAGTNCVATANFPAVDKLTKLAAGNLTKIHSSLTIAGVTGTMVNCSTDGGTGCLAVTTYPAADSSTAGAKILTGQSVAGVTGTADVRPVDCSTDGGTSCVAVSLYPAVNKTTLNANVAKIRSGTTIAGVAGTLADCSTDGGNGCVVIGPTYAAALTTGAAAKILTSQSVAGIAGSAAGKPVDCSTDGGIGCVTITAYPAALLSGAVAKILTGQTLAGVAGSAVGKPVDCTADGAIGCVTVTNFPAVNKAVNLASGNLAKIHSSVTVGGIAGTLADCSIDGAQGCYTVSAYRAATFAGAGAKIINTATLVGVTGTAVESPAACSSDGQAGCVTSANFPAVNKTTNLAAANLAKISSSVTVGGVTGTMSNCSTDGGTNCMAVTGFAAANASTGAAKIISGQSVGGISGSAAAKPADCAISNDTGCVAVTAYPSIQRGLVTAGVIKTGTTLIGITGNYPSATSPLASNTGTADLTSFSTSAKSATGFEFFDSAGTRYTGNGDANIIAGDIKSGIAIFGVSGSWGPLCTVDGEQFCVNSGNFSAADTSTFGPWDIRRGDTVAGIAGKLLFPTNNVNLTLWNNTTTPAVSGATADKYDTIDDFNGGGSFPTATAAGLSGAPADIYVRDPTTDTGVGSGGVVNDGLCNGTEQCIYIDQNTGLSWSKDTGATYTWQGAINYCNTLNLSGTGWRLATHKELLQSWVNGMGRLKSQLNLAGDVWAATTISDQNTRAYFINVVNGITDYQVKTATIRTICVR